MEHKVSETSIQTLRFHLQNTHVCMDICYVDKIIPLLQLEPVPNCPLYLVGLMNMEEKIIPVIDLAMRVGICRDEPYTLDTPILLCTYDTHQAGLIVDKVEGLIEFDKKNIQMHEEFNADTAPFIGSITLNEELSLLLNMNYIFPLNINIDFQKKRQVNG
ncbi:MAG: chemotaxis protein CheW [Gammaproteobacteria bacterium]|nr:chemotaxis protein CheW [Gammaproteobacteria bacterium]